MTVNSHILRCNGATAQRRLPKEWASATRHDLLTFGSAKNVRLEIEDLTDRMYAKLDSRVRDLIEIATLVYAADQYCKRTGRISIDYGDQWRRELRFEIAVRDRAFWASEETSNTLAETLSFLSDDKYEFRFQGMIGRPSDVEYLKFNAINNDPERVERVILFSGGLDSLTGAVDEILVNRRRVALVSHKPVDHLAKKQRELVAEIAHRASEARLKPVHFPVLANRIGEDHGDYTQRTRSFLYASLAAAVARYFELNEIWFYENGIVSVNLPLCGQIIGGRATRTTHPQSLDGFSRLFSLVLERPFRVNNGFIWETKEDMLDRLTKAGHSDLAKNSLSCTHTRGFTAHSPHCGLCSQCISRRVAALGANYGENDPSSGYRDDVLCGARQKHEDRILAERFVGTALEVETMTSSTEFHKKYALELGRVCPYLGIPNSTGADRLFELHARHSRQVGRVMRDAMTEFVEGRRTGTLPESCMAYLAYDAANKRLASRPQIEDICDAVKRLNDFDKKCICALAERNVVGPHSEKKPTQEKVAAWMGVNCDAHFKSKMSTLVRLEFLDNDRHRGGRGGYFLTDKGERAADILIN